MRLSRALPLLAVSLALLFGCQGGAFATVIAYEVPTGTVGNQEWGGALGMEFDVNQPVVVFGLGVFDSSQDGLARTLEARLYDRDDTSTPLATLLFTPQDPGLLVDGSRLKRLASPVLLPSGFHGCIVADGYGLGEPNGNGMDGPIPWTVNDGGGLLSFVGGARWDFAAGIYPMNADSGPANRYAAGTFEYALLPEPGTLTLLGLGGLALLTRRRRTPR